MITSTSVISSASLLEIGMLLTSQLGIRYAEIVNGVQDGRCTREVEIYGLKLIPDTKQMRIV